MIELPEAITLSKQLNETVVGTEIVNVTADASPHKFAFYTGDPAEYHNLLVGRKLEQAQPLAGYIHMTAGDTVVRLGEGLSLRYLEPGQKPPAKHQLLVEFSDGSMLVASVRMYGVLAVFKEGSHDNPYYKAAREKPFPLGEAFTPAYFESLVQSVKPALSIKALLATEQRIPGLGNGVLQDILLHAHIHPKRKVESLSDAETVGLYNSIRTIMADMAAKGGRDTEKDIFGNPGGYQTLLSSKTWKYPCLVCGGPLQKQAYMGGSIYFCTHCQPL